MADEQEVIENPQIEETPEQEGGPGPQPSLSEENRKKLDSIVSQMVANKESDDNIKKVVEDFKGKYSSIPINIGKVAVPAQKVVSESTAAPTIILPKALPGTTLDRMNIEKQKAHDILRNELTGNNDLIPSIIKKQKSQSAALQGISDFSNQPKSDQPLTTVQKLNNALIPKTQEPEITTDDITRFDQNIINNEQAARGFLHHIADMKPDKAKAIQAALYTSDASNRVDQDPSKASSVLQNAKKIQEGKLVYNIQGGHLIRPENAWESIGTGLKAKNQAFADYDIFSKATPEEAISELEKRRMAFNPDEPTPAPNGFISELTGGMASQPIKGLVAGKLVGGLASLVPAAEEFAPVADNFVSAAVSGNDFRKMSYANSLQKYYNQLRASGMGEKEAYDKANGQAKDESAVDAIAGGAMMLGGGKIAGIELPKFSLSEGFNNAVINGIKQGAKGMGEAGAVGLIQGAAQDAKNKLADMKGIEHDTSGRDIEESVKSGALFTLGIAAFAKGGSLLSSKTRAGILQGLSKATPEQIDTELGSQILEGHITPEEAQTTKDAIEEHRTLDQSIPENVTDESRAKIQDKIKRREELESQLETADKAFHPEIKEKIKAVNEDILELSKDKKPKGEEDILKAGEPEDQTLDSQLEKNVPRGTFEDNDAEKPTEGAETTPTSNPSASSISTEDVVISKHFEGPQKVRSVSEDGTHVFIEGPDHQSHEIPIEDITLKIKQNASRIRENQSGAGEEGVAGESGENPRSQDLQLAPEQTSGDAETPQQAREGEIGNKPPIDMHDLPFEPESQDVTRLAHKNTEELYEDLNTSGRIPRETKQDTKLEAEADDLIKNGFDFEGKANRILDGDERLTDTEQVGFAKMVGALKAKLNHLDITDPEFDRIQDKIELLSRASDKAGSETGAALRARRMFVLNDQTLSDYLKRDKESLGVDELTEEQKSQNKKEYEEIQKKQEEYDKKIADLEKENAKLKAENELKKTKSGSKKSVKKSHEDYVKERKDILKDAREALLKAAKGEGGLTASVPGAAQLAAIAPHVAKLVKSLVEEGVDKLEDVVKSIHGDLKDVLEGITEKDIHDIIAGEYKKEKPAKGELAAKIKDLKEEARLINKLEALQRGDLPKGEKEKIEKNKRLAELRKQISDLQKERIEPKDMDKTKLESIKKRNESELKKVQEAIAKGEYEKPKKPVPILQNKDIRSKNPELVKEVQKSADALIAAKKDRELRLAKQQYENRKPWERRWDTAKKIWGLRRALNTAFDFSVPFRQASRVTLNPLQAKTTGRAFRTMFQHTFSPKAFDRWFFELEQSPDYLDMQKDKLYISSPDELRVSKREEQFESDLAGKIPILKEPFNASQRAASSYLNEMRVDMYRRGVQVLTDKGINRENNPEAFEALAKLANNLTGRGNLLSWLEGKPANAMSQIFYGPRLMASKFNLLNPVFYYKLPKEVRKMALMNMAGYVGFSTSVGMLANAAGASVTLDQDDPDFLKIKVGDTKYDITGGEAVYVRTFLRIMNAARQRINGDIDSEKAASKAASSVTSFFRNKLAPNTSYALNAFLGKTSVGQPFNPVEAVKYYPMWIDDIVDDWKQDGAGSILAAGVPSVFGIGVQTYVPKGQSGGTTQGGGASGSYDIKQWK